MGIIAILMAVAVVAINPGRQFAQARNTERLAAVNAIASAIGQNMSDNNGLFTCAAGAIPSADTPIASGAGGYDISPCIVPVYLPTLPLDPSTGASTTASYSSGYSIHLDSATSRIILSAPSAELGNTISIMR